VQGEVLVSSSGFHKNGNVEEMNDQIGSDSSLSLFRWYSMSIVVILDVLPVDMEIVLFARLKHYMRHYLFCLTACSCSCCLSPFILVLIVKRALNCSSWTTRWMGPRVVGTVADDTS